MCIGQWGKRIIWINNEVQKQPWEVFYKTVFLKIFAKFTGKHLCESLFVKEHADLRPATLLKRESGTGVFLWILRILMNTFFSSSGCFWMKACILFTWMSNLSCSVTLHRLFEKFFYICSNQFSIIKNHMKFISTCITKYWMQEISGKLYV